MQRMVEDAKSIIERIASISAGVEGMTKYVTKEMEEEDKKLKINWKM